MEQSRWRRSVSQCSVVVILVIAGLTLLRFAIGMVKFPTFYFRDDEWATMLAASMVAHKGLPILPSGLFYEHGLLFSYIEGLVFVLGGFHELMARWPGVLINTIAIPLAYRVGREMFRNPVAGLLVAASIVFDSTALEWGWRARMYGLGHVISWLLILSMWYATMRPYQSRYRLLALGVALLSLVTHLALAVTIAALGIAWLVVSLSDGRIRRALSTQINFVKLLPEIGGILFLGGYAFLVWKWGFASHHGIFEDSLSASAGKLSGAFLWQWGHEAGAFLYILFLVPTVVGIVIWPISYRKSGWTRLNKALVFLYVALAFIVIAFVFILGGYWWRTHYLYLILLPLFMLAGVGGLISLAVLVSRQTHWFQSRWMSFYVGLSLSVLVILAAWSVVKETIEPTQRLSYPPGHPYAQAFAYIDQHWQPGDQLMTPYMAVCALYSEHCSHYISQTFISVYEKDGQWVNLYNGKPWLETTVDLAAQLARPGHLWFVSDSGEMVSASFVQLGLIAMDSVFTSGYVGVYREKDSQNAHIPLTPNYPIYANFADQVEFLGYHLDEAQASPGNSTLITLFWCPLRPLPNYKVFVHLRDEHNETVAQFDHFPSEILVPFYTKDWKVGEIFPDVARLDFPAHLASGRYRLLVGLYDPETFIRVPVNPDTTGENAVVIMEFKR